MLHRYTCSHGSTGDSENLCCQVPLRPTSTMVLRPVDGTAVLLRLLVSLAHPRYHGTLVHSLPSLIHTLINLHVYLPINLRVYLPINLHCDMPRIPSLFPFIYFSCVSVYLMLCTPTKHAICPYYKLPSHTHDTLSLPPILNHSYPSISY